MSQNSQLDRFKGLDQDRITQLTNEDITSKLTMSYVEGNHQSDSVRGIEGSTG